MIQLRHRKWEGGIKNEIILSRHFWSAEINKFLGFASTRHIEKVTSSGEDNPSYFGAWKFPASRSLGVSQDNICFQKYAYTVFFLFFISVISDPLGGVVVTPISYGNHLKFIMLKCHVIDTRNPVINYTIFFIRITFMRIWGSDWPKIKNILRLKFIE